MHLHKSVHSYRDNQNSNIYQHSLKCFIYYIQGGVFACTIAILQYLNRVNNKFITTTIFGVPKKGTSTAQEIPVCIYTVKHGNSEPSGPAKHWSL